MSARLAGARAVVGVQAHALQLLPLQPLLQLEALALAPHDLRLGRVCQRALRGARRSTLGCRTRRALSGSGAGCALAGEKRSTYGPLPGRLLSRDTSATPQRPLATRRARRAGRECAVPGCAECVQSRARHATATVQHLALCKRLESRVRARCLEQGLVRAFAHAAARTPAA